MVRYLLMVLSTFLFSACGLPAALAPTPTAVPSPTPVLSATAPMQTRCVMGQGGPKLSIQNGQRVTVEEPSPILVIFKSSPAVAEVNAIAAQCSPNGTMGPSWHPMPITTPTDGYQLICQGDAGVGIQATAEVWAINANTDAASRAYNGCHAFRNARFVVPAP